MNNIIKRVWNQNRLVNIEDLTGMVFQAEIGGHTFEISGIDDTGAAVELSGTVSGVFRRPDNADIALTGSASDGVVSVTLSEDCYAVPGRFGMTIFVTSNSQKVAVYACVGTVAVSSTGNVAGDTPASVEDLIDDINAAIADLNSAIGQIPASYANVMAAIAPTYSSSALYPVGSYTWYDGALYRCITPITTAETWTAAHWTAAVLANDVGELNSAFNNPNVMDYAQSEIVTGYSVQTNGSLTQGSGNVRDVIFPVTAGKTYTLYSPYLNRSGLVVNSTKSFSVGSTYTRVNVTITGNYAEFTIPSGATWALFNFYTGSDYTETISSIKLYEQKYSELDENIRVKPQNLPSNIVYKDENGFPPLFDSLSDSFKLTNIETTWNAGKLLDVGGTVVDFSDEDYIVSDAIDISAYDYLYLSVSAYTGKLFYAFYTSDSAFITAKVATGSGIDDFDGYIEVPQNAKYLKASGYDSINHNIGAIKYISGLQTSQVKWEGKTWVCIGDSLTEENAATDKHYYDYVSDVTGISIAKPINSYAKGGTGYANPNGTAGNFVTRMASIPTDADVYTIFGSFNDVAYALSNNIEIGSPSDSGTTTMCGYFNAALDAMFDRIPLANVGVVAPCPWQYCYPAGTGANSTYGKAYVEALEAVCKRRSIPFLNLFNFSGMRPWEEGFRALVYTKDQAGGVHPNEIGHKILSTKFKAFLESLLL